MLPKLWTAMDNSMPDRAWRRHFGVDEKLSDADDCFPLARNGARLGEQCVSARVFGMAFAVLVADRLGLAGDEPFDPRRSHAIQSEFERGRAAVQRKHIQQQSGVRHTLS